MKKILSVLVLLIFAISCGMQDRETGIPINTHIESEYIKEYPATIITIYQNSLTSIELITYNDHSYIIWDGYKTGAMVHDESCKNIIHKKYKF